MRCRTTTASTPIASIFLAVSMKVSPFDRLLPEEEKSTVSAPKPTGGQRETGAGASRVLEEQIGDRSSRQQIDLLEQLSVRALNCSAVSRIVVISSADKCSRSSRSECVQVSGTVGSSITSVLIVGELGFEAKSALWSAPTNLLKTRGYIVMLHNKTTENNTQKL